MDSMSKSSAEYESPEESSWTMYFEDFSNKHTIDHDHMNESTSILYDHNNHQTSSLIPEGACSAAGRRTSRASLDHKIISSRSLSFKKRKIGRSSSSGFVDHDLEDTATSPANSPKVYNLVEQFDKQKNDDMRISQEIKGSTATGKMNEELGFSGGENVGNELKKKGLCLVPLSMVVHYLG